MKRRFTILTAALALLAFLAIPMGMMGQTRDTQTVSYGWETTDDVEPWTISETIVATQGEGNTGTYAGKINTNSTTVQFNEKVYVTSFSYAFKRTSNNNNYSVYIETSTDGSNWSIKDTQAMNTFTNGSYRTVTKEFDGTQELYVRFRCNNTTAVRYVDDVTITYNTSAAQLDPCDLTLTNASTSIVFDLYNNSDAYVINYTTSSTGEVTVADSDYVTTEVDQTNKTITVTPVAVTNGAKVITVNQAADDNYAAGSKTFTINITDSTPFSGGDVTFDATVDKDLENISQGEGSITKLGVTFACNNGILGNGSEYRMYKNSVTTFSVSEGIITQIAFTGTSGNPASGFATQTGWTTDGNNGTWTGNAQEVSFTASGAQVRATLIVVTVDLGGAPAPSITANDVDITYDATSGEIEYTINSFAGAGFVTATSSVSWLTFGDGETGASVTASETGTISFNITENTTASSRQTDILLQYIYGDNQGVTTNVTITQAAAPVIYTTIPALFEAATSTATDVTITFGNWVISAVHNSNAYLTDNQGHGLIIYASNHGFQVNDVLTGTVNCKLQTYRGSAELTNLTSSTEGLNVVNNGTVTEQNIAINSLGGVNTGALLAYQGLTYNGTALVDGNNNTITPYSTLYSYTFEEGKTYNVKGIYLQYNSTKEILPRSAADIEEVVVTEPSVTVTPNTIEATSEGAQGTLTVAYENMGDSYDADVVFFEADGETQATYSWLNVTVNEDDNIDYVILANDGAARTAYLKVLGQYGEGQEVYSNLVTINQAAPVAPVTGDKYVKVTSTADLTSGQYLIVYEEGSVAFNGSLETLDAANNTIEVVLNNSTIAVDNITVASEFTIDMTAGTVKSASGYYIGQSSDANGMQTSMETAYTNSISFDNDEAIIVSSGGAHLRYNATSGQERFRYYKSSTYTSQKAIQLYKKVGDEPATETHTLTINGYQDDENEGGYALIASPVNVDPATVGMTTGDFDLYYFDESQELEWRNYEATPFNLVPGKGYLYAKKATTENQTYSFELTGTPYSGNGMVDLAYTENAEFAGFNLIGNPFNTNATLDMPYYRLNQDGSALNTTTESSEINVMEGVFVQATAANQKANFTKVGNGTKKISQLNVKVTRNRSAVLDNAIIRFDEGATLNKFQLNANSTKLYFTEGNQDFAVVRSANEGEMPVNFKAAENGTYTISINAENVDVNYLHLIDNMTGADVDLLATPSYSFEAKVTDYASRFRLVFNANSGVNEQNSETFAFFNGNNLVINNEGEATLQVIDMMGRTISSEQISGSYNNSLNLSAGVYVLRLSNGNTVKTQKIVID